MNFIVRLFTVLNLHVLEISKYFRAKNRYMQLASNLFKVQQKLVKKCLHVFGLKLSQSLTEIGPN